MPVGAVGPFVPTIVREVSPYNTVQVLARFPWYGASHDENVVSTLVVAVSTIPHTRRVGQSTVNALLYIASVCSP